MCAVWAESVVLLERPLSDDDPGLEHGVEVLVGQELVTHRAMAVVPTQAGSQLIRAVFGLGRSLWVLLPRPFPVRLLMAPPLVID